MVAATAISIVKRHCFEGFSGETQKEKKKERNFFSTSVFMVDHWIPSVCSQSRFEMKKSLLFKDPLASC